MAALLAQSIRRELFECTELVYALGEKGVPLLSRQAETAKDINSKSKALKYTQNLLRGSTPTTTEILESIRNDKAWRWSLPIGPDSGDRQSPMTFSRPASMRIERAYQTLVNRRDERSMEYFWYGYNSKDPAVVNLCAVLLAHIDPEGLAASIVRDLDTYRASAWSLLNNEIKIPSNTWDAHWYQGWAISSGLIALADLPVFNPDNVMPHIMALSCPDREFSQYAAKTLRKT